MILQSLVSYYDRIAKDPSMGLAPYGYSRQRISFCVVIHPDGRFEALRPVNQEDGKYAALTMVVPGQSKPSGAGINPCLLWDNSAYMLGWKSEDPKPDRTVASFEAFRKAHLEIEPFIDDAGFKAVCRFLESWDPARAAGIPEIEALTTNFGVFRLAGEPEFVHDRSAVKAYFDAQAKMASDSPVGLCLVSGQVAPIARLHEPKVRGVMNANPTGALLVSFNEDAYTSFGKEQGFNAPVSEESAFKYASALNQLLEQRGRRVLIGDSTVVFWAGEASPIEDLFAPALDAYAPEEDQATRDKVRSFLVRLKQGGQGPSDMGELSIPFYLLALSPNAARLSVRFWLVSSVGEMLRNLSQHVQDMHIVGMDPDERPPIIRELILETAREPKDIAPQLAGELLRSVVTGLPYPMSFYQSVLRRIRADRQISTRRAGILRGCLNRQNRSSKTHKEVSVSLNPDHPDIGYQLGRLFAVLESIQSKALPGLNDTIKDRYFGTASATPVAVFPRLLRLSQHHLGKVEGGLKVHFEKAVQSVIDRINRFPSNLSLEQQGLFAIGYYHQRQDQFTSKEEKVSAGGVE